MGTFEVDSLFVLDLRDDFIMNNQYKLYQFLGKDPIKAFHLGVRVVKWFELLTGEQQYLHSKSLRRVQQDISEYSNQIAFWTDKFPHDGDTIEVFKLAEYIYDNMFWNNEDDKVKVALFLGMVVGKNVKEDDELLYNVKSNKQHE